MRSRRDNLPPGPGPGRPKGVPNKVSGTFKAAVLAAFEGMGGMEELRRWGQQKRNRAMFYQICARLIPSEVVHSGNAMPVVELITHQPTTEPAPALDNEPGRGA
jgi:hypothetical protein